MARKRLPPRPEPSLETKVRLALLEGDVERVEELFAAHPDEFRSLVNEVGRGAYTFLTIAAMARRNAPEMCRLLIDQGADPHLSVRDQRAVLRSPLVAALQAGSIDAVRVLVAHGVDIGSRRADGTDVMIEYLRARHLFRARGLLEGIRQLAELGAPLDGRNLDGGQPLRMVSSAGRFDAVRLLLELGAKPEVLQWNRLIHEVVYGTIDSMAAGFDLEDLEFADHERRTPFLFAVQIGDIAKANWLMSQGCITYGLEAEGISPYQFAVRSDSRAMLEWLYEQGFEIPYRFGSCLVLDEAIEWGLGEPIRFLIDHGVPVPDDMSDVLTAETAGALMEYGLEFYSFGWEARERALRIDEWPESPLAAISNAEFGAGKAPRFGRTNPQVMNLPFWEAMTRSCCSSWSAGEIFEGDSFYSRKGSIWCNDRAGQTWTVFPDGRLVQIGGCDADGWQSYNDVIVFSPDGAITIYGYPEEIFPSIDYHSSTVVDNWIYILSCSDSKVTAVFRLDTVTFHMEAVATTGSGPGNISRPRTRLIEDSKLRVEGGRVYRKREWEPSDRVFELDLTTNHWQNK